MEMYYVREYTLTCRFLTNNQLDPDGAVDYF